LQFFDLRIGEEKLAEMKRLEDEAIEQERREKAAREEAERVAKEEAERKAKEEAERTAREEAERVAKEAATSGEATPDAAEAADSHPELRRRTAAPQDKASSVPDDKAEANLDSAESFRPLRQLMANIPCPSDLDTLSSRFGQTASSVAKTLGSLTPDFMFWADLFRDSVRARPLFSNLTPEIRSQAGIPQGHTHALIYI